VGGLPDVNASLFAAARRLSDVTAGENRTVACVNGALVGFDEGGSLPSERRHAIERALVERVSTMAQQAGADVVSISSEALTVVFGGQKADAQAAQKAVAFAIAVRDVVRGTEGLALRAFFGIELGELKVARAGQGRLRVGGPLLSVVESLALAAVSSVSGVLVGRTAVRATRDAFVFEDKWVKVGGGVEDEADGAAVL
jgi:hypothetical protein